MKRLLFTIFVTLATVCAQAAAPNSSGTYYSAANGKKGAELKTELRKIIYNHTEKSYDYLWTAFTTTDVRSDGKVWDMYSNITNYTFVTGGSSYPSEGAGYNREHSFPRSWFGGAIAPMNTDLHHIYPTDGYVNNQRSNYPFGETSGNNYKSANSFSKLGTCTVSGYTGKVFEPDDEYKGDFARTYFYMITCYEEKLKDWYDGNAAGVTATIDGSTYPGFQIWQLNMLLKWAKNDPVSQKEIDRNNAVKNIQNNRNPFIDYPGLEQYIWGSCKDTEFSYDNYVQPTTWSTEYNSSGSGSGGQGGQGGGTTTGEEKTITLTYNSFGLETSYAMKTATVDGYGFTVNQGFLGTGNVIQMNSSKGSGILYNTTAIPGLKSIAVNVSTGEKTYTITTGISQNPTANSQTGTTGGTYNAANGDTYFQLKVSGASYFTSIVITYNDSGSGSTTIDPTFNALTDLNVNFGSTLTLTQGTTGTPNFVTDGTVTLTSLNTNVATVSDLTITPVAVGECIISVNTSATSAYNAGSTMFTVKVNAPAGGTTAKPSESGLLFGETFGNNTTNNARDWDDSFSVKSGVSSVYSGITGYTTSNVRQSKNTAGSSGSGLNQKTQGTDASIIIGPLNVADYSNLTLTYQWKAGSTSATYTTSASYATSANGTYTALTGSGNGATTFVQRSYSLPDAAQVSTLYLKIVWNTSNTGAIIDEVQLTGSGSSALNVTLNSSGYATYCSEYPLDFSNATDYSAWQVTGVSGTTINFSQVTGKVKGGTGLLLMGEAGETVTIPSANSSTELDGNLLYGTLAPTYVEDDTYYGLSGTSFVKVNAGTVPAGKALLPASVVGGSEVKSFTFVFEGGLTPVPSPESEGSAKREGSAGAVYDLSGRRIANNSSTLPKGIYIRNGKKFIIK